jgi:hypothetical protein
MKIVNSLITFITHAAAFSVVAILAFTVATTGDVFAQGKALIGSWTLDTAKSRFDPGPVPYKSMTLKFSAADQGLKGDIIGVDTDGQPIKGSYTIVTDGKEYPVTGISAYDSTSYTPVGDNTTVYVRQKLGTTVVVGTRVLSKDGKTLIYREKSVDRLGRDKANAFLVFNRS